MLIYVHVCTASGNNANSVYSTYYNRVCVWETIRKGCPWHFAADWHRSCCCHAHFFCFCVPLICVGAIFQQHNRFKGSAKTLHGKSISEYLQKAIPLLIHPSETLPKARMAGGRQTKYQPWMFLVKIMSWKKNLWCTDSPPAPCPVD